jgi:hypothetical protein
MSEIYKGNAGTDGSGTRGWIVGSFIPEGVRHSEDVEIKWGIHKAGEGRDSWATGEQRTTICLLISGNFAMQFRDREVALETVGDYVMWGEGTDHKWQALEDSVVMTIRWGATK